MTVFLDSLFHSINFLKKSIFSTNVYSLDYCKPIITPKSDSISSLNLLLFLSAILAIVGIFNFCMTFGFNYQIKKRPAVISIEITLIV